VGRQKNEAVGSRDGEERREGSKGGLMCNGKPMDSEVIYWREVPGDREFESPITPHHDEHHLKYLTFQYDQGGWNNIRMGMEIVIVCGHAMGRTLVSPPQQKLYLLGKAHYDEKQKRQVRAPAFSFADFFDLDLLASHQGFHVTTMDDFLTREGVTGKLHGVLPPRNESSLWGQSLWAYLSEVADVKPSWSGKYLAMPRTSADLDRDPKQVFSHPAMAKRMAAFGGKRSPVYYNKAMRDAKLIHFPAGGGHRLLQHWYAFTFFADPKLQSFYKRFVRDFMRYKDVIQCAGAELVRAVREDARVLNSGSASVGGKGNSSTTAGDFYALHVRRGDFQFKQVKISATEIIKNLGGNSIIPRGAVVYISTDDPKGRCENCLYNRKPCPKGAAARGIVGCIEDPSWTAFREIAGWKIRFLGDYIGRGVLKGVNPNYYGMIESIVCSRAKVFAGTWWSTFTGYIHRLRGYHGLGEDTFYHSPGRRDAARSETSIGHGFSREWRYGWTDDGGGLI